MLLCSLIKGLTPKIRMLCFVILNGILFNRLCVWILSVDKYSEYRIIPILLHEGEKLLSVDKYS